MPVSERFMVAQRLVEFAAEFDRWMERALPADGTGAARLAESMRYSALAPGKRLRPFLLVRCCEVAGGSTLAARPAAVAMECVHAFSLIHDDLPAMDDDDFRRGRPSNHRQFDEATAILAGDGLLALAFGILAESDLPAEAVARLVRELSDASGPQGMIGGQALDIEGEVLPPDLARVRRIHDMKTARLFEACGRMGAICAGAGAGIADGLARYARRLGLAFQIADDVLDVTSTLERLGKRAGKDGRAGKQTYPACLDVEASRQEARRLADEAVEALHPFGPKADDLRELPEHVLHRQR